MGLWKKCRFQKIIKNIYVGPRFLKQNEMNFDIFGLDVNKNFKKTDQIDSIWKLKKNLEVPVQ